jgi:mannose-1-phosphate guanylyltransferase/mannose-6-phosphate isomerase
MLFPVILSGGSGSRLWPLSRGQYPKQLLSLFSEYSMLQDTVKRLDGLTDKSAPLLICNEKHRFLVAEQLQNIDVTPNAIILEPVGRNTAAAAAVAAFHALAQDEEALLLILPSDHVIAHDSVFHKAVKIGENLAQTGYLVTFGVVPQKPETGYGYIKTAQTIDNSAAFLVEQFVEKPNSELAQAYLRAGNYFWNSGMFLFKASTYLEELEKFDAAIFSASKLAFEKAKQDMDFLRLDKDSFTACPSNSIDYSVMEHTRSAAVIPLDAGWSDVGSWTSLWEISKKDYNGNVTLGDVVTEDTWNSYLRAENRMLATIGVEDLVIIETSDALLVAHKESVQDVKEIVTKLKAIGRSEVDFHKKVRRPWGSYEGLGNADRFQVKHIIVQPNQTLSLQMHYHRSEHWVVVKGSAEITRGEETFLLTENQSTYIPLGTKHRLRNPGKMPLEIIEVQSGSYLGEDDIVRFEDVYGRNSEN